MSISDKYRKWDLRFLNLARHVAQWSKDPSTKVGAVITDNNRIVSLGYNGFPMQTKDTEELYLNREEKYKRIVHAETNAILFAKQPLEDCTIYTWPIPPCSTCAGLIIQSKIYRVVSPPLDSTYLRWLDNIRTAKEMFKEAYVIWSEITNEEIETASSG